MKINDFSFVVTCIYNDYNTLKLCLRQLSLLYPKNNVDVVIDYSPVEFKDTIINDDIYHIVKYYDLNINILEYHKTYPDMFYNKKDKCLQYYFKFCNKKYICVIDDDTIFINNGLIEWCYINMQKNNKLILISEFLKSDQVGQKVDDVKNSLDRVSNWFMFINVDIMKKNNINFIPPTIDDNINYLKENLIEAKRKKLDVMRFDMGYFYVQIKKHKFYTINLYNEIFFYHDYYKKDMEKIEKEMYISNGNSSLNYYYMHIGSIIYGEKNRKKLITKYLNDHKIELVCHDDLK